MNTYVRAGALAAVSAAIVVALVGCDSDHGDDAGGSARPSLSSGSPSPSSQASTAACEKSATTGPLAIPAADADLRGGQAAFQVTLDDGTAKCVTVARSPDEDAGEWDVDRDKTEFEFRAGDWAAGLLVSMTDRAAGAADDLPTTLPGALPDPFVGLQVDGVYFPDGWHTGCDVTVTALSGDLVSGEFACKDIDAMADGPFVSDDDDSNGAPTGAKKLTAATGWFVATKS